jgi:hypothetical protein
MSENDVLLCNQRTVKLLNDQLCLNIGSMFQLQATEDLERPVRVIFSLWKDVDAQTVHKLHSALRVAGFVPKRTE